MTLLSIPKTENCFWATLSRLRGYALHLQLVGKPAVDSYLLQFNLFGISYG